MLSKKSVLDKIGMLKTQMIQDLMIIKKHILNL